MPFDISRINKKTYLFYTVKRTHMTWSQVPLLSKTANTATVLPNALSDSIATSVKSILISDKIVFKIQNDFINECVFLIKELFHVVRVVFSLFAYVNSYQKKYIISIFSL